FVTHNLLLEKSDSPDSKHTTQNKSYYHHLKLKLP
ncbi:hypothetical protein SeLEV6574_g07908, partial [Synchytrium endobioticum]